MEYARKPHIFPYMQPGETLDYDIDFTRDLATGETVQGCTVTVSPTTGLTLGTKIITTPRVKQWTTAEANGGGVRYALSFVATTSGGRIINEEAIIPVEDY